VLCGHVLFLLSSDLDVDKVVDKWRTLDSIAHVTLVSNAHGCHASLSQGAGFGSSNEEAIAILTQINTKIDQSTITKTGHFGSLFGILGCTRGIPFTYFG